MSPISEGGDGEVVDGGFGEVDCFGKAGAGWEKLEDEGLVVAFVQGGCVGDGGRAFRRGGKGGGGGVGGEVGVGAGGRGGGN